MAKMERLTSQADLERALAEPEAVIYKHSTRCNLCDDAHDEMKRLLEQRPDTRVYIVDVLANRDVSNRIADKLGVRHQSPQAIVVRDGRAVWDASHFEVRAEAVSKQLTH